MRYVRRVPRQVASVIAMLVVGCSSSPRHGAEHLTGDSAVTPYTPPPAKAPESTATAPQRFMDGDLGYRFTDPDRKAKLVAAAPRIDAAIADEMSRQHVPGLAFGLVIDGELVYSKGYGVIDLDNTRTPDLHTAYRIGSVTKSFTSLGILALRDDGVLTLDDPLTRWVPEASGLIYPTRDARPITLRQLLTHTSGLPREYDRTKTATESDITAQLQGMQLENPPGQRFVYSNIGFVMLGLTVARASHSTFRDVIGTRIFAPLGMTETAFDHTPAMAPAYDDDNHTKTKELSEYRLAVGGGGIVSTIHDLARYVAFQLAAYPPRNDTDTGPIHRATIRESHATGFAIDAGVSRATPRAGTTTPPGLELDAPSYGFGWVAHRTCDVDDLVEHNGAIDSYRSGISMLVHHGVGVIVLSNFGNTNTTRFNSRVLAELRATGALKPYVAHPPIAAGFKDAMARFLAVYTSPTDAGLRDLLARDPEPNELDEIRGYAKLHGACKSFELTKTTSATEATFAMTCEHGTFEVQANFARGKLIGFAGTSRGIDIPAAITKVATSAVGLINKWDDGSFARTFTTKDPTPLKTGDAALHASLGACKLGEIVHEAIGWGVDATCDRGTVHFYLELDGPKVARFQIARRDGSVCAAQ